MTQAIKHFQKPWQILVSVCLTRMRLISRELNDIEKRYAEFQEWNETKLSVYNDYEYRKRSLQAAMSGEMIQELTEENTSATELAAMQDEEDIWAADSMKVTLAPRRTEEDKLNDRTSLHRHLNDVLYFVVDDAELLNERSTLFPYDHILPDESLRLASERVLKDHGITANTVFLSNAPAGCIKVRYKEDEERGNIYQGAKVFVTKAQIFPPHPSRFFDPNLLKQELSNKRYEWLTLNELQQNSNLEYYKRIVRFM